MIRMTKIQAKYNFRKTILIFSGALKSQQWRPQMKQPKVTPRDPKNICFKLLRVKKVHSY